MAKHWSQTYDEYLSTVEQYSKDHGLMTPLEKQRAETELSGLRMATEAAIEAGAVAELRVKFADYENAQKRLRASLAGAQKQYDPARLQTELDLASREAARATDVKDLQRMFDEAEEPHRVKAVAEVLASLHPGLGDQDAHARNRLSRKAEAKLVELKFPSTVLDAMEEGGKIVADIVATRNLLTPIAIRFDSQPLKRELSRVQVETRFDAGHGEMGGWERKIVIGPEPTNGRPPETHEQKSERLLQSSPGTLAG